MHALRICALAALVLTACGPDRRRIGGDDDDGGGSSSCNPSAAVTGCAEGARCIGSSCCPVARVCGSSCCAASQVCAAGQCKAPDCSPSKPAGTCPSGQMCVSGACCTASRFCGELCCPQGQVCDLAGGGACVTTTCSGGSAGSSTGGTCPAGLTCLATGCCPDALLCGGACCGLGETCAGTGCCPTANVCGSKCCAQGESCLGSSCCPAARACGSQCCAAGQTCEGGTCRTATQYTCSASVPNGTCPPGKACLNGTCCDPAKVCGSTCCGDGQVCNGTACVSESNTCSSSNPYGSCPSGQTCMNGACCANAKLCGEMCCGATQVCDTHAYACRTPCSGSNPGGWCPEGQSCQGGTCRAVQLGGIGAPCTQDGECSTGSCLTASENGWLSWRGYCSQSCSETSQCPSGECLTDSNGQNGLCMLTCETNADCGAGLACYQRMCVASCVGAPSTYCRNTQMYSSAHVCDTASGRCRNPGASGAQIGGACTADSQCPAGAACFPASSGLAGGYCIGYDIASCADSGACPYGSVCRQFRGWEGCLKGCSGNSGCRTPDYACASMIIGSSYQRVCWLPCTVTGECPLDGNYTCNTATPSSSGTGGTCIAYQGSHGAGTLGAACDSPADCAAGLGCYPQVAGFPSGYCTNNCTSQYDCSGGLCTEGDGTLGVCLLSCSSCSRSAYACDTNGVVCLPACSSSADCPGMSCDTSSGFCQ